MNREHEDTSGFRNGENPGKPGILSKKFHPNTGSHLNTGY